MTIVAGVDVGNTTTEIVLVDTGVGDAGEPLAWDRVPTRGMKGSQASVHGAAALLRRLERRVGRAADLVAMARLRPVRTTAATVEQAAPTAGRLTVVDVRGGTTGGTGTGVGRPIRLDAPPDGGGPVVALVPAGTGYQETVQVLTGWIALGVDVRAVLLADDEAVLVAARLPAELPVADEVDLDRLADAVVVAVELRAPGHQLIDLVDPFRLSTLLDLPSTERSDAVVVAEVLGDRSRAVVAVVSTPSPHVGHESVAASIVLEGTTRVVDVAAVRALRVAPPGAASAWQLPGWADSERVDDLWAVDVREVAASVAARADITTSRSLVLAGLRSVVGAGNAATLLGDELDVPVVVAGSEAAASRRGALSTPGVGVSTTVVDLGGGTVDAIAADGGEEVVAGAGEMLTVVVSTLLGLPRGAADWVKRGPSARVEEPQLLLAEDGARTFLDDSVPGATVGSLVVPGPAGLLPFGRQMAPAEWRSLRLRTKERVLLDNVARALAALSEHGVGDVLLVGGAAADDELVGLLRPLVAGRPVGRGNVAGRLGHRYAVAYGLALLATSS